MVDQDDTSRLLGHRTTSDQSAYSIPTGARDSSSSKRIQLRDFLLGITLLLLVVALWTAGSFITADIETGDYNKPWLLTYLGTASFSFYLLRPAARQVWLRIRRLCSTGQRAGYVPLFQSSPYLSNPEDDMLSEEQALRSTWSSAQSVHPELTTRQTLSLAFEFCLLWFAANYTLALALAWTSVSSVTILSATSGFFALGFGHLLGFSPFTLSKLVAVLISLMGVVLVSKSDSEVGSGSETDDAPPYPLWGDMMAICSAIFYACYVSLVKVRAGDESRLDMPYFLGLVGLINTLLLWPVGVALSLTGMEPFELPSGKMLILAIIINSLITFTSDFIYLVAMLLTSPLTVTLGLSLTIPLAVAGDILLGHAFGGIKAVAGAVLVVLSFIIVGLADAQNPGHEGDSTNEGV